MDSSMLIHRNSNSKQYSSYNNLKRRTHISCSRLSCSRPKRFSNNRPFNSSKPSNSNRHYNSSRCSSNSRCYNNSNYCSNSSSLIFLGDFKPE